MIDTTNLFGVSGSHDKIVILRPRSRLTYNEALNLAAWLVAIAEPQADNKFEEVLKAVCET